METWLETVMRAVLVGVGATAVMDAWLGLLQRLNVPTLNFSLVGRWVGHVAHGRWFHPGIGKSAPVAGETTLGWLVHYATGIGFALLLVLAVGPQWLAHPTPGPALGVGIATVLLPWLVMQPAMGSGIASSRTATPWRNCLRSIANHAVFGMGLYITAIALARARALA